ncbi:MAG: DNA alkylation repair protein [Cytophagales bacterium]|nr:DNA alkylation repair protein [Cytophagales bacterium]
MKRIIRKKDIQTAWMLCQTMYVNGHIQSFADTVYLHILSHKVKFPLLEYVAQEMYVFLPQGMHISFCDQIERFKSEGGNVLLGKLLQLRMADHFDESLRKAVEYISNTTIWYVCDIIGERVFGYGLLHFPSKMLPEFQTLSSHHSNWVIRALGAGMHYAIKKGLEKSLTATLFEVLLGMAHTNDKEVRQGVGWAAKTTARYHPDIIVRFERQIQAQVPNWFRKKIEIGLIRNHHAQGD